MRVFMLMMIQIEPHVKILPLSNIMDHAQIRNVMEVMLQFLQNLLKLVS